MLSNCLTPDFGLNFGVITDSQSVELVSELDEDDFDDFDEEDFDDDFDDDFEEEDDDFAYGAQELEGDSDEDLSEEGLDAGA